MEFFNFFINLTNPRHWFNTEPGQPSFIFAVFAGFYLVAIVVAAYVRWRRKSLFFGDGLNNRIANQATEIVLWIAGVALFLIAMRYLNVPFLATPFLFYIAFLVTLAFIGYGIWYVTQRYPRLRVAYELEAEKLRYLPNPRRQKPAPPHRPARQRATAKR